VLTSDRSNLVDSQLARLRPVSQGRHRIVAVRQRRKTENRDPYDNRSDFGDFEMMVRALVK
jgi:hypothetical protein